DFVNIKNHFHHADLLIVYRFIKLFFQFWFTNVICRESKLDPCQWTCECRVTSSNCFSCKTSSFTFSSTKYYYQVFWSEFICEFFNPLLILKIHCACARSDETFC